MEDCSKVLSMFSPPDVALYGGAPLAERQIARFGNPDILGYEIPFPIAVLCITPLLRKFSENLTHRDYLGALMHLGIERDVIGDIVVRENRTYVFVLDRMSDYIMENLFRVRHTSVRAERITDALDDIGPRLESCRLIVPSLRLDVILSRMYHLSRQEAKKAFSDNKVFLNSKLCISPSASVREEDVLSVRGYGKFIFRSFLHETRKGNMVIDVDKYI